MAGSWPGPAHCSDQWYMAIAAAAPAFSDRVEPCWVIATSWVQPATIWDEDGQRLGREAIDKTPKKGGYGLHLEPHQIRIVDMPQR